MILKQPDHNHTGTPRGPHKPHRPHRDTTQTTQTTQGGPHRPHRGTTQTTQGNHTARPDRTGEPHRPHKGTTQTTQGNHTNHTWVHTVILTHFWACKGLCVQARPKCKTNTDIPINLPWCFFDATSRAYERQTALVKACTCKGMQLFRGSMKDACGDMEHLSRIWLLQ